MSTRDLVDDRQAQAAAIGRRVRQTEKTLTNLVPVFGRYARTGIFDLKDGGSSCGLHTHGDRASARRITNGIIEQDAETLRAATTAEVAAARSLAIARRQAELGDVSYLATLNAELTYQQALLALVQAKAIRYADTAALFQALGGGWWNRSDGHTS